MSKPKDERREYEAPEIIYEGELTTRAGTGTEPIGEEVDPSKLFGSVD